MNSMDFAGEAAPVFFPAFFMIAALVLLAVWVAVPFILIGMANRMKRCERLLERIAAKPSGGAGGVPVPTVRR